MNEEQRLDWGRRIDAARPPQYKTEDLSWAEPLLREAMDAIDPDDARYEIALRWLKSHERTATAKANRLLREVAQTGTMPLDWMDAADLPIVLDSERIKLAHCTPRDLEMWELHERRRAADQFGASNASCDGARLIHDWMLTQGVVRFAQLDPEAIPTQGVIGGDGS